MNNQDINNTNDQKNINQKKPGKGNKKGRKKKVQKKDKYQECHETCGMVPSPDVYPVVVLKEKRKERTDKYLTKIQDSCGMIPMNQSATPPEQPELNLNVGVDKIVDDNVYNDDSKERDHHSDEAKNQKINKIISDWYSLLNVKRKSTQKENEGKQNGGDIDKNVTKLESGDEDEVFYEIDSSQAINYAKEFEEFKKFIQTNIHSTFGIVVPDPKLNFSKFKSLIDNYGSRHEIENNSRIQFKPQIIVMKNFQNLANDGVAESGENPPPEDDKQYEPIYVSNEEVYIYPNELKFI